MNKVSRILIGIVFLIAYGSFLWASLHHIAFFFANFEPTGINTTGSYALAISIDVTSLVLTISMMFFQQKMRRTAKICVWSFIFALTAFSWLVNWEYAIVFEHPELTHLGFVSTINPILASSFAFLNLAYSLVAEQFTTKTKTLEELENYAKELEDKKAVQQRIKDAKKGTGMIAVLTEKVQEFQEVKEQLFPQNVDEDFEKKLPEKERDTGPITRPNVDEIIDELETKERQDLPENTDTFGELLEEKLPGKKRYTMTLQEAALHTGHAERYLKTQIKAGAILLTKSGKIKVSSLEKFKRVLV